MKVVDMHCDTISAIHLQQKDGQSISLKHNDLHLSLEKMQKGDYLLQNFAMFTPLNMTDDAWQYAHDLIDTFYHEVNQYPDLIGIVKNYQDIQDNIQKQRMSALLTLEEGAVVRNQIQHLQHYYDLGVRMITLTWNFSNGIGYPNFSMDDPNHGYHTCDNVHGLTEFGKAYVQECERLGIIIDVSHLSDAGFEDVYRLTTKPFVASHSNARSVCPHARNLTDEMILKLEREKEEAIKPYLDNFLEAKKIFDEKWEEAKKKYYNFIMMAKEEKREAEKVATEAFNELNRIEEEIRKRFKGQEKIYKVKKLLHL